MAEAAVALANDTPTPAAPAAPTPPPADTPAPSAAPSADAPKPDAAQPSPTPIDWQAKYRGETGKLRAQVREMREKLETASKAQETATRLEAQIKELTEQVGNYRSLAQVIRTRKDIADLIEEAIGTLPDDGSRERAVAQLSPEVIQKLDKVAQLADRAEASQKAAIERQAHLEQVETQKELHGQIGAFLKAKDLEPEFLASAEAYVLNRIARMPKGEIENMPSDEVDEAIQYLLADWAKPYLNGYQARLAKLRDGKIEDAKLPPVAGSTAPVQPAPAKHALDSDTKRLAREMLERAGWDNSGRV